MEIHFNIKDIFYAPRSALNLAKILTFLRANIAGYTAYLFANYLALFLSGNTFIGIWQNHGLYPCAYMFDLNWYSSVLFWTSSVYWFLAVYGAMCAVSRITLKELKGNYFYSIHDAHSFIEKNWRAIILTPITIIIILAFYILATSFFGILSKIPWIGSIIISVPFFIYLIGAVFSVFTIFTLLVSIVFTPAIVGTTNEDTMGSVFNSYMLAWRYPFQIIAYKLILIPLTYLSQLFLLTIIGSGFKIMNLIFSNSILMGERFTAILGNAASVAVPKKLIDTIFGLLSVNFYNFFIPSTFQKTDGVDLLSIFIIGFFMLIVVLMCFSYALSVFSTGTVYILNIFKKKSGINLIEADDNEDLIFDTNENDKKAQIQHK